MILLTNNSLLQEIILNKLNDGRNLINKS